MTCETNQESTADVILKVNGKEIELNAFVTNFISETVFGMIRPLRDVDQVETVSIEISRKS